MSMRPLSGVALGDFIERSKTEEIPPGIYSTEPTLRQRYLAETAGNIVFGSLIFWGREDL